MDFYDFLAAQSAALERQPRIPPPLLKGDDLIALSMKPGAAMGALLAEIREKQLQDELKTPAQARRWAKGRIRAAERAEPVPQLKRAKPRRAGRRPERGA
ncbi:MAG TPA: hypothetical protein VN829_06030 [Dongiaceae bacterium]|nr:hypothetical protein [Dongiaceae bacterium]